MFLVMVCFDMSWYASACFHRGWSPASGTRLRFAGLSLERRAGGFSSQFAGSGEFV